MLSEGMQDRLTEAAHTGAAFLDREFPNWADTIRFRLDMASCSCCVLGQVFGEYFEGKRALFGPYASSVDVLEHGFDVEGKESLSEEYTFIEDAWAQEIAARCSITEEGETYAF